MNFLTGFPGLRSIIATLRVGLIAATVCGAGLASAGYVTTHETALDAIFSQPGFRGREADGIYPIDVRFNAALTVVDPLLTSIDSGQELDALLLLATPLPLATAAAFFVDTIGWCGATAQNIVGCGFTPGDVFAVNSSRAADLGLGANLLAHELAHNLGLNHTRGSGVNLMDTRTSTNSFLDASQVATIFDVSFGTPEALIQTDIGTGQRYITITPFAVVAAAVPEPQVWLLMSLGLLGLAGWTRRRKAFTA